MFNGFRVHLLCSDMVTFDTSMSHPSLKLHSFGVDFRVLTLKRDFIESY